MPPQKDRSTLVLDAAEEREEERADERSTYLQHGRTLAVSSAGMSEIIEIRSSSGQVELRINMTEDGPVLQLDGVKLSVKAAESIQMQCKTFAVEASESVEIASRGETKVTSEGDVSIESTKDVRVRGDKIWLN